MEPNRRPVDKDKGSATQSGIHLRALNLDPSTAWQVMAAADGQQ